MMTDWKLKMTTPEGPVNGKLGLIGDLEPKLTTAGSCRIISTG